MQVLDSMGTVGVGGNYLDVVLKNVGDDAVAINVDRFEFNIGPFLEPELTFLAVTIGTDAGYIFAGNSTKGPMIDTAVGSSATASDSFKPAGAVVFRTVNPGDTVGLGRVFYSLTDGPLLPDSIDVDFDVALTGVFIGPARVLVDEFVGGKITVLRLVPEPSSLALGLVAVAGLAAARIRRRPGVGG